MNRGWRRQVDNAVLVGVYATLIGVGLLIVLEFSVRQFVAQETSSELTRRQASEAYSYFSWRDQYFRDYVEPGGQFRYAPFYSWEHADKKTPSINIEQGLRRTWEAPADETKSDFLIFMFGGSTTYAIEVPDDLTIASLLAKKLNAQNTTTRRYVVRNYGASAFNIDNEAHRLVRLLAAGQRPDLVIFYDGLNEIQVKVGLGRTHYFEPSFRALLFEGLRIGDHAKEILRLTASKLRVVRMLSGRTSEEIMRGTSPFIEERTRLNENATSMLKNYSSYAILVRNLGKAYGFRSLFFWQPNMFVTGKVLTAEEIDLQNRAEELIPGDRLIHEVTVEALLRERFFERSGVIDIQNALDEIERTTFVDTNHITSIGNAAIADKMFASILDN